MSSSEITLRYVGEGELGVVGIGAVSEYGDELVVTSRKQADRLLALYDFEEVDPDGAAEEEED